MTRGPMFSRDVSMVYLPPPQTVGFVFGVFSYEHDDGSWYPIGRFTYTGSRDQRDKLAGMLEIAPRCLYSQNVDPDPGGGWWVLLVGAVPEVWKQ